MVLKKYVYYLYYYICIYNNILYITLSINCIHNNNVKWTHTKLVNFKKQIQLKTVQEKECADFSWNAITFPPGKTKTIYFRYHPKRIALFLTITINFRFVITDPSQIFLMGTIWFRRLYSLGFKWRAYLASAVLNAFRA